MAKLLLYYRIVNVIKMSKANVLITKASGRREPFSVEKLRRSLERAGAESSVIDRIVYGIGRQLFDGMSTKKIYSQAFSLLREYSKPVAGRYKTKQAILELGPSGYPFEKFIGEILKYLGYSTKVGVIIQGHCVSHEIDVEAEKDEMHFMVECKFHSRQGFKCDVKIPLYINSRYEDVKKQWMNLQGHATKFHQGWVVTNTRFTEDAIQYGRCSGLNLISWDYPQKGSLSEWINFSSLYPITCLTTLSRSEKQQLLDKMVVLCREICENPELLRGIGVSDNRIKAILKEGNEICSIRIPD